MILAVALGMSVTTAMIAVATSVSDKIDQELRTYGANLMMTPPEGSLDVNIGGVNLKPVSEGAFIRESDLPRMKGIFWGHNIVGFAPFLDTQQVFLVNQTRISTRLIGTYFSQPLKFGKEAFTTGVRTIN